MFLSLVIEGYVFCVRTISSHASPLRFSLRKGLRGIVSLADLMRDLVFESTLYVETEIRSMNYIVVYFLSVNC